MAGSSAIRGSKIGSGPMGESERGEAAPRTLVAFYCANGHETTQQFALEVKIPDEWDCPRCGYPAGRDPQDPPAPPRIEPYKTHLAYVKERRSEDEGAALLEERLRSMRADRDL